MALASNRISKSEPCAKSQRKYFIESNLPHLCEIIIKWVFGHYWHNSYWNEGYFL